MVTVEVIILPNGDIKEFTVSGHADFGAHGKDIVCSAVSVLTQTTVLGLLKIAEADIDYKVDEGYLYCKLNNNLSGMQSIKAQAILKTMYEGIKNIRESYSKYIIILEKRGGVADV